MKFREGSPSQVMKLSLADLTAEKKYIEFGPKNERISTIAYREKVEQFIRDLEANNPVVQKLKARAELSHAEVKELATLLESQRVPARLQHTLGKLREPEMAAFIRGVLADVLILTRHIESIFAVARRTKRRGETIFLHLRFRPRRGRALDECFGRGEILL